MEAISITDPGTRVNALMTGEVDAISRIDAKSVRLLERNPAVEVSEVTGNQHYSFPMITTTAPYDDNNVRLALKLLFDREEMVRKILLGHGKVGNDHPIGPANRFYAADLEQRTYDPDMAKHLLKKAGVEGLQIDLSASDAAFAGAVDAAQLFQQSAQAGGVSITVIKEPADGYWSNVWDEEAVLRLFLVRPRHGGPDVLDRLCGGQAVERQLLGSPQVQQAAGRGSHRA